MTVLIYSPFFVSILAYIQRFTPLFAFVLLNELSTLKINSLQSIPLAPPSPPPKKAFSYVYTQNKNRTVFLNRIFCLVLGRILSSNVFLFSFR